MKQLFNYLDGIYRISPPARAALEQICKEDEVLKNCDLQPIGHSCRNIYFIISGVLRIYYIKDGNDITESFEFENSMVARADSVFSGQPSRKGIQAVENTTVIAINTMRLFELYDHYHDIERLFRKLFEQAYVQTVNRIESLQFHTAEERYKRLLTESGETLQRVPLKHIATYLGITQVSLSRIRSKR